MSQADRLLKLLSDGKPHSTLEIRDVVYGAAFKNMSRIASRVNDLKNRGYTISGKFDADGIYWYTLSNPPKPKPKMQVRVEVRDGKPVAVIVRA